MAIHPSIEHWAGGESDRGIRGVAEPATVRINGRRERRRDQKNRNNGPKRKGDTLSDVATTKSSIQGS